jgi:hypothetical protein
MGHMSYDLGLKDSKTDDWYELTEPHHMRGGTYAIGGTTEAKINITYNYYPQLDKAIDAIESDSVYAKDDGKVHGIRVIYGMTGADSVPLLERGIERLGDDVDSDYWKATEGNAKAAIRQCLALAKMCPDGIWDGD